ncbi:MAG: cytochrome c biogenesis protein CcsA [Capsulimonadaceae bacterium]
MTKPSSKTSAERPFVVIGKIALLLLQAATIVAGFLWLRPALGFANPSLARIMVFHVPCPIVGAIASIVATWYAIAYLRRRNIDDDIKSRTSFALALLLWVLTTVTGSVFSKVEWGAYWNWDIKQSMILTLLLIYVAYFALRAAIDNPNKQATLVATYAIFATLIMPFLTYILPNSTPDTLHPKNVINTPQGMDAHYRVVFLTGAFCLSMVYVWVFRIQVRIERLLTRVSARRAAAAAPEVMITKVRS